MHCSGSAISEFVQRQLVDAYAKIKREDDHYYGKLELKRLVALHRELY